MRTSSFPREVREMSLCFPCRNQTLDVAGAGEFIGEAMSSIVWQQLRFPGCNKGKTKGSWGFFGLVLGCFFFFFFGFFFFFWWEQMPLCGIAIAG